MKTLTALAAAVALLVAAAGSAQVTTNPFVPAGIDCWSTQCGSTETSFCENPIPPNFFDPGSEPFSGAIRLQGASGGPDTHVQRRQDMLLDPGTEVQIPIEIVSLNLVSCEPIVVHVGQIPTQWDVKVDLSPLTPPPPGTMTVRKTHDNGGTFTSEFNVLPRFTFTKVGDPSQVRVLDTGMLGLPPDRLELLGTAPWVHEVDPAVNTTPCGINFVPGVEQRLKGKTAGSQCCVETCHAGATPTHCVVTSRDCSRCPGGACCFPGHAAGRCATVRAHRSATAREICEGRGGTYGGDGSTCADSDGDGLEDILERGDCCGTRDGCHTGTSPIHHDSDNDGVSDGQEIKAGTDPCDPTSFAG